MGGLHVGGGATSIKGLVRERKERASMKGIKRMERGGRKGEK